MKASSRSTSILVFALFSILPASLPSLGIGAEVEGEVADNMHEYLTRITAIKSYIIMGNLDRVRDSATWLVEHEAVPGLPGNFESYVEMMRSQAREVVGAPDLKSAAKSASRMASTCGSCHLVNDIEIEFGFDTMPEDWADSITHMQRHQWAADRLWEGLIGPSDVAWSRGTDMLVDVPLSPADFFGEIADGVDLAALDEIAHRVHVLGGQGTNIRTPEARSNLYGELLGLCADCHTALDSGPGR